MSDPPTLVRLNKYIAQCGVASRRGADDLVFSGRVAVNGVAAASPGLKVDPAADAVTVDGKPIGLAEAAASLTLLLNKPIETVTTVKDPQGRTTALDLLPPHIRKLRPFPVGRLDYFSEGALLLTTDGELCHRLTHPKWHQPKVYEVTVRGKVSPKATAAMEAGMRLKEGELLAPVQVSFGRKVKDRQILRLTLHQGVNRQIRRMCRDLGLTILRLRRIKQGPISLGGLKPGQWREVKNDELRSLRQSVGLT